jgi:hypothetical protein
MNWLAAVVQGLFSALLGWGQSQAEKPKVTTNANTPKTVRDKFDAARDEWLRDKKRSPD